MTIPASIESQKEKQYAQNGRRRRVHLMVPHSHWEDKMIEAGFRKVKFARELDNLIQYELHE